jgi:DNA-binding NtrC family response regulator
MRRDESRASDAIIKSRFALWFEGVELPDLSTAMGAQGEKLGLLVRGEPGTCRELVARYVNAFGEAGRREFAHVPCGELASASELLDEIGAALARIPADRCTLWLDDVDRLPARMQRMLAGWIRFGLPSQATRDADIRWFATADEDDASLNARLAVILSTRQVRLPPLRETPEIIASAVDALAREVASEWGRETQRFSDESLRWLTARDWPGNHLELEHFVRQILAKTQDDPIEPDALGFDPP